MIMFKKNFVWGVSAAAYQIEGATNEGGRTPSVWDMFCLKDGAIERGETGDIACDFYHKYKEDIALMKSLGVKAFRFSLSWSRLLPTQGGKVNEEGAKFYDNVINELISSGITPYITLFHWDLPMYLYEKGGFMNREFADEFAYYAKVVVERYADRVKHFITFNEPQCILGCYRGSGQAPGLNMSDAETVPMAHNILLAHGRAVKAMRKIAKDIKIGFANQGWFFYPEKQTEKNIEAAKRKTLEYNEQNWHSSVTWFSDPIYLGKYPEPLLSKLKKYLPDSWQEDLKEIYQTLDFYGQNYYNATMVDENGNTVNGPMGAKYNSLGWNVIPEALRYAVEWLYERYKQPIYITENGMCCHDWVSLDGKVHDPQRIDYIQRHLIELDKAVENGVDLRGYFVWSVMDNMEWTLGYRPRFGLVYVDYETQKRIPKDSALWYKTVIESNGENIR